MDIDKKKTHRHFYLKSFILFFIPFACLSMLFNYILYKSHYTANTALLKNNEINEVRLAKRIILDQFEVVKSDLDFFAVQNELKSYLVSPNKVNKNEIQNEYKNTLMIGNNYNSIRFLDYNGNELIKASSPNVSNKNEISNANAVLANDMKKHLSGDYFVSKNILYSLDAKNNAISCPVLQIGKVIGSGKNIQGFLVIDYSMKRIFNKLRFLSSLKTNSQNEISILNSEAEWILFAERKSGTNAKPNKSCEFSNTFPQEWKTISAHPSGQFSTKNGIFTFQKIEILPGFENRACSKLVWILLRHYKKNELSILNFNIVWQYIVFALIAVILIFLVGLQYAHIQRDRKVTDEALQIAASTDPLTSLKNRRSFLDIFAFEIARMNRYNHAITLLICDLDHFKLINDSFGHNAGDSVLRKIACILQENIRLSDIPGRWGGEEFIVLLPETTFYHGFSLAERLRKIVEATDFEYEGQSISLTLSFGISFCTAGMEIDECIKIADEGLYLAKKLGRNITKSIQKDPNEMQR